MVKKVLWLLPFGFFVAGYGIAHLLFKAETLQTPSVIGLPLATAIKTLSEYNIGARIAARKPSTEVPEDTVLIQSPGPLQAIKTHQTVFLVVAEQPPLPTAPNCMLLHEKDIVELAQKDRIAITYAHIPNQAPHGTCIAQYPAVGQPMVSPSMLVYLAENTGKKVIWPSFIDKTIEEVVLWLEEMHIPYDISSYATHYSSKHKVLASPVIDQYPRPGTIVHLNPEKLPHVRLHIP